MITCGFYNSKNHDRKYDATQISSMFDGIIQDGIYMDIGDQFMVFENSGMVVNVGTGRAWFNHTWTVNDAAYPIRIDDAETLLNRIDTIVLEVNSEVSVRNNKIKVIKGTPGKSPVRPTLTNTKNIHQYPLASIRVEANTTSIRYSNIQNHVGTSETPYVTGVIQTMNIDNLIVQWWDQWNEFYQTQTAEMRKNNNQFKQQLDTWYNTETTAMKNQWSTFYNNKTSEINSTTNQWNKFYSDKTNEMNETSEFWKKQWSAFYNEITAEMTETNDYWKERWQTWFYDYINTCTEDYSGWKNSIDSDFNNWWDSLKDMLEGNPDANFANEIINIQNRLSVIEQFMDDLSNDHAIYDKLYDDSFDEIEDNSGDTIKCAKTVFLIK